MMAVLDEFKTRHATITADIEQTYRIGNRLLDFIEKQIIIDFHLKGEHEKMKNEFPHLEDKAKKFLGFETFFDLSVAPDGVPMSINDPYYDTLIKKSKDLHNQIQAEIDKNKVARDENPNLPDHKEV